MSGIYNSNNLPEYLVGDNLAEDPDQLYLIRCHAPRFIGKIEDRILGDVICQEMRKIEWIDPPPSGPQDCARLMREAGDWLADEMARQEIEIKDEEEN